MEIWPWVMMAHIRVKKFTSQSSSIDGLSTSMNYEMSHYQKVKKYTSQRLSVLIEHATHPIFCTVFCYESVCSDAKLVYDGAAALVKKALYRIYTCPLYKNSLLYRKFLNTRVISSLCIQVQQ